MDILIKELKKLKHSSGLQLEKSVECVLKKLSIKYTHQPNGTQRFPDFYLDDLDLNLECKSSVGDKPMWNCTYPKSNALYVISCKKLENCIVIYGKDIVSESVADIYDEYARKHKDLEKEINDKLAALPDNKFGMKVFARNMYVQSIGFHTNNLEELTKKYKTKDIGQYFTVSKDIQNRLLDDYNETPRNVLEPSCGIGHLINLVYKFDNITAIDVDCDVISISKSLFPDVEYLIGDFLEHVFVKKFDLIVGNPPYFEISKKDISEYYSDILFGRVNIYYLFVYKCIQLLELEGQMRLILPSSFLSNKYAEKCREFLLKHCEIIDIVFFDSDKCFENAIQNVIILKCKRKEIPDNTSKVLPYNSIITNDTRILSISGLTIKDLNCVVKTGNIIWNENKHLINNTTGVKLYYSSDISDSIQTNDSKKKYISINENNKNRLVYGPCVLVQRIIAEKVVYKYINYTPSGFFVENHVNIITGDELSLQKICKSFDNPKTTKFIKNVFRSNHLSKNELQNILQIYL